MELALESLSSAVWTWGRTEPPNLHCDRCHLEPTPPWDQAPLEGAWAILGSHTVWETQGSRALLVHSGLSQPHGVT